MFNRPPGAMLFLGHTHQWRKGRNCSRVLSQHTAAIGTPTVTVCSVWAAGGTAFLQHTVAIRFQKPPRRFAHKEAAVRFVENATLAVVETIKQQREPHRNIGHVRK